MVEDARRIYPRADSDITAEEYAIDLTQEERNGVPQFAVAVEPLASKAIFRFSLFDMVDPLSHINEFNTCGLRGRLIARSVSVHHAIPRLGVKIAH